MRQGARPIRHRSWTKTPWHEGRRGQERWERWNQKRQRGAGTLSRQRGGRERHVRDAAGEAGLGGQHLVAKPVTSPDSARATEPRRPEAALELRRGARGARFGRGAGEREASARPGRGGPE